MEASLIQPNTQEQIQKATGLAQKFLAAARGMKIADDGTRTAAVNLRHQVKGYLKQVEDNRVALTKPLNDHVKRINEGFRQAAAPAEEAAGLIDKEITRDHAEQQRIADEARRKAEEEARRLAAEAEATARKDREEQVRLAREKAEREAREMGFRGKDVKDLGADAAAVVESKPIEVATTPIVLPSVFNPPKTLRTSSGAKVTIPQHLDFEVTDEAALYAALPSAFELKRSAVLDFGRCQERAKQEPKLAGVRFFRRSGVSG